MRDKKHGGEAYKRGVDAAAKVMEGINDLAGEGFIAGFLDRMGVEHRTLQQSFTRLCVGWLQDLAVRESYDLRNEASVKLAMKLKPILDDSPLPFI